MILRTIISVPHLHRVIEWWIGGRFNQGKCCHRLCGQTQWIIADYSTWSTSVCELLKYLVNGNQMQWPKRWHIAHLALQMSGFRHGWVDTHTCTQVGPTTCFPLCFPYMQDKTTSCSPYLFKWGFIDQQSKIFSLLSYFCVPCVKRPRENTFNLFPFFMGTYMTLPSKQFSFDSSN